MHGAWIIRHRESLVRKPIPPKTTAKLAEAEHYVLEMRNASESSEGFRRHVANFLTAARSVKDVLIKEIAAGDVAVENRIRPAITRKMNADSEMRSMIKTRDAHIHEGDLSLRWDWIPESPPRVSPDAGLDDFFRRHRSRRIGHKPLHRSRTLGMPQGTEQLPRAFFAGIAGRDAYTVCVQHLEKVKKATDECVQLYA